MGDAQTARVDVAGLNAIADRFEASAEDLTAVLNTHLGGLAFGGATAGRLYAAKGDALRTALRRLSTDVANWSRASTEVAFALRAGAHRYADTDARSAAEMG